jgi:hypothetical protein
VKKNSGEKPRRATADGRIHVESSESLKVIRETEDAGHATEDAEQRTDHARWRIMQREEQ